MSRVGESEKRLINSMAKKQRERKNCPMRHDDNGNCLPCGGFCTSVSDAICHALHNAYDHGVYDAKHQAEPPKEET